MLLLPSVLPEAAQAHSSSPLEKRLREHAQTVKRNRQVIRFFANHGWLLTDPRFSEEANRQLRSHRASLAKATRKTAAAKAAVARHRRARARADERKVAGRPRPEPPTTRQVICKVFGDYCDEAIDVAHCESRFKTDARNGQYLGIFQMGSSERELFGHGTTASEQAEAAHRYFVRSGRDWSPWSCKP